MNEKLLKDGFRVFCIEKDFQDKINRFWVPVAVISINGGANFFFLLWHILCALCCIKIFIVRIKPQMISTLKFIYEYIFPFIIWIFNFSTFARYMFSVDYKVQSLKMHTSRSWNSCELECVFVALAKNELST